MPHINRIRLVDVGFNDAKSFYDDFRLSFNGKSATYDLENGGGKSVLLMMMLQVLLPNTALREDKPLKNIFIGGKDRTSHVLIEWVLDNGLQYKYMLTGFCARRIKQKRDEEGVGYLISEEGENTSGAGIEYFNYFYLYNEPNQYDIYNMPICSFSGNKRRVIQFDALKDLIRGLNKKNLSMNYFDRRGEYISFLKNYNLINTEWKIIGQINSGENSIEKYFRQNKTSRKLIENLLIKIVEDTKTDNFTKNLGDGEKDEDLANILINIRENLNKLSKDQQYLYEYNQILDFYNKIKNVVIRLKDDYQKLDDFKLMVIKNRNKMTCDIEQGQKQKQDIEKNLAFVLENLKKAQNQKDCLDIALLEHSLSILEIELKKRIKEQEEFEVKRQEARQEYNLQNAQNDYLKFKNEQNQVFKAKSSLENLNKDADNLKKEYAKIGFNYKLSLESLANECGEKIDEKIKEKAQKIEEKNILQGKIAQLSEKMGKVKNMIESLVKEKELKEAVIQEKVSYFQKNGKLNMIMEPEISLKDLEKEMLENNKLQEELEEKKEELNKLYRTNNTLLAQLEGDVLLFEERRKEPLAFMEEYKLEKSRMQKLFELYDIDANVDEGGEDLDLKLTQVLSSLENEKTLLEIEQKNIDNKLQRLDHDKSYVPNDEILVFKERLAKKYKSVYTGLDLLNQKSEAQKEEVLEKFKLLPYSILLLEKDFLDFKKNIAMFEKEVLECPLPVFNLESVRSMKNFENDDLLFLAGRNDIYVKNDALLDFKEGLQREKEKVEGELLTLRQKIKEVQDDKFKALSFMDRFTKQIVDERKENIKELEAMIENTKVRFNDVKAEILENKKQLDAIPKREEELREKLDVLSKDFESLDIYISQSAKKEDLESRLKEERESLIECEGNNDKFLKLSKELDKNINILSDDEHELKQKQREHKGLLESLSSFEEDQVIDLEFDKLKEKFNALKQSVEGKNMEEDNLREKIDMHQKYKNDCEARIVQSEYSVAFFKEKEEKEKFLNQYSDVSIQEIKLLEKEYDEKLKQVSKKVNDVYGEAKSKEAVIKDRKQKLIAIGGIYEKFSESLDEVQINERIQRARLLVEACQKEKKDLEKAMEDVEQKTDMIQRQLESIVNFIDEKKVENQTEEMLDEILPYNKIIKEYAQIDEKIDQGLKNLEKEIRIITIKATEYYISDPIKQLDDFVIPKTLVQAIGAIGQLENYVGIIHEQIGKTKDDIEVLKGYQEEFVRQCIQRAERILDDLKKFSSLSRIDVDGKLRNMIEVKFSDYSQEEKFERMKNHIKSIVKEINTDIKKDTEGNISVDRVKIAMRLSSKELLARITDMDKVVVKLFKVESVNEHSAYKKWENAVGSEGQSNALYFIFAVCLISYIRMLSVTNSSIKSKKVIIADNPFGATSAVYLWEPMFRILKENDVQLIAPGHNINKALTSKFEVNYILNQEILEDSRIKVVVRDVRTEEDLDKMKFEKMKQLTFE